MTRLDRLRAQRDRLVRDFELGHVDPREPKEGVVFWHQPLQSFASGFAELEAEIFAEEWAR